MFIALTGPGLMPRLAAFDVPASRDPRHLWMSDARTFERWCRGEEDACLVQVAVDSEKKVVGLAMATLRPELLSEEPSSHLEAIAVAEGMAGKDIGRLLLDAMEDRIRARGAPSMSLHVFASNTRARRFYEKSGYDGELTRISHRLRGFSLALCPHREFHESVTNPG